uniref:Uncharacterized protein n=1 Tax=Oryzias latipes TaxID=8090 RepID=A0A3P9J2Y2_ORYLA
MTTGPRESSPLTFQIGSTSHRRSLKPGDVSAQVTTDFRPRLSRCFDLLSCGSASRGFGLGRVMQIDQFLSVQLCRSKGSTEDLFWMNSGTDELEEDNGVQESCDDILQNQNTSRAS